MKLDSDAQKIEELLAEGDRDKLNEAKEWLSKENERILFERSRLKQEENFFDQKMEILKGGFAQLEEERRELEKKRLMLEAEEKVYQASVKQSREPDLAEILFQGVKSPLALKKRYRDLIKIFHPDNIAGDHEMVLRINKIYEELKRDYDRDYDKRA
ncbi:MAG: hypothetical protein NC429_01505 [Lachnospiraceae bacterium]|nr:hypothetical protein [Lachnospiraceae bacterium]